MIEQVGDETVVLDTESKEAHCLSPLAAAVFAGADGSTRVEDLAERISSDDPVSVEQVEAALAQLDERGLLDRPALPADPPSGISRRQLVRRTAGATAAISAVPLVTSIVTPAFAAFSPAGTCREGALCVSQAEGDKFCSCNNACPQGSPGGGTDCPGAGLGNGPSFDSCVCGKCPTPGEPKPGTGAGAVHRSLPELLPGANPPPQPCTGPNANRGCNNTGKPVDGICFPNDGDSSETCLQGEDLSRRPTIPGSHDREGR